MCSYALQGDGNIRYYEVLRDPPYIRNLNQYQSPAPQKDLGICSVLLGLLFVIIELNKISRNLKTVKLSCYSKSRTALIILETNFRYLSSI